MWGKVKVELDLVVSVKSTGLGERAREEKRKLL